MHKQQRSWAEGGREYFLFLTPKEHAGPSGLFFNSSWHTVKAERLAVGFHKDQSLDP